MAKLNRKEFQHAVSVLKKKGLIPATVNARKAEPFNIRGGKRLDEIVKKHRAVVEDYDKAHAPRPIEVIDIDVPYHNLEQYLRDAIGDVDRIEEMKRRREFFSFRFHGYKTFQTFDSAELMLDELLHYESIANAIASGDAKQMAIEFEGISIVRVPNATEWKAAPNKPEKKQTSRSVKVHKATKDYWKKVYANKKKKLAKGPMWKKEQAREQNAERQKQYRERLNKSEQKAYKADARDRAAESRANKKKAKKKGKKK